MAKFPCIQEQNVINVELTGLRLFYGGGDINVTNITCIVIIEDLIQQN